MLQGFSLAMMPQTKGVCCVTPGMVSRRALLLGAAGALAGGAGAAIWQGALASHPTASEADQAELEGWLLPLPARSSTLLQKLKTQLEPRLPGDASLLPALVRWFPQLHPEDVRPGLKLLNALQVREEPHRYVGRPGEGVLTRASTGDTVPFLPWAPLFHRAEDPIKVPPQALADRLQCRSLRILDEGSETQPLFGNKARKYELLLPGYAAAGVERLTAVGALGSNHILQLALANRLSPVRQSGGALDVRLDVSLYPQPLSAEVRSRLRLVRGLTDGLTLLPDESRIALAHAEAFLEQAWEPGVVARVSPGGSNPATVLGHVNAVVELALALKAGSSSLLQPPDVLFVALGSGATTLGILLGLALLGWQTKVIGVASQDRGPLARVAAGGTPGEPFVTGALRALGRRTERWLQAVGFPMPEGGLERLLSKLEVDAEAWKPAYGVLDAQASAWVEDARSAGIVLDSTFAGKAWSALWRRGLAGGLRGQHVLFWNSFSRFPYAELGEAG